MEISRETAQFPEVVTESPNPGVHHAVEGGALLDLGLDLGRGLTHPCGHVLGRHLAQGPEVDQFHLLVCQRTRATAMYTERVQDGAW